LPDLTGLSAAELGVLTLAPGQQDVPTAGR